MDKALEAAANAHAKELRIGGVTGKQALATAIRAHDAALWRPIEEAPKDGTPVLIWCPKEHAGAGAMHVSVYMKFTDRPGWYSHISAIHDPTYFRPLPDMEGKG